MIAIKSKFLTTLLTVTIGLAGCATTDPYTGEEKTTNTTTGAAFGAIAGAFGWGGWHSGDRNCFERV